MDGTQVWRPSFLNLYTARVLFSPKRNPAVTLLAPLLGDELVGLRVREKSVVDEEEEEEEEALAHPLP